MTRRSIGTIDNDKKMQRRDMQREGVIRLGKYIYQLGACYKARIYTGCDMGAADADFHLPEVQPH